MSWVWICLAIAVACMLGLGYILLATAKQSGTDQEDEHREGGFGS